ncbi:MAG: PilX N-terminal domain-containing pilus assembly protein [Brachymonas sp.]
MGTVTFSVHRHTKTSRRHASSQAGVALIVSLIMLALMSIVGIAGVRSVTGQERMVNQVYDRTVAFQAAEAALREIEIRIETSGQLEPLPSTGCSLTGTSPQIMMCGAVNTTVPRWQSTSFADWADATVVGTSTTAVTPQYFVEYLGNSFPCTLDSADDSTCKRYRITARATPGSERARVVLQSIYATFRPS